MEPLPLKIEAARIVSQAIGARTSRRTAPQDGDAEVSNTPQAELLKELRPKHPFDSGADKPPDATEYVAVRLFGRYEERAAALPAGRGQETESCQIRPMLSKLSSGTT